MGMKIQKSKAGQFFITLPKQIVLAKGWNKGTELKCRVSDKGELILLE